MVSKKLKDYFRFIMVTCLAAAGQFCSSVPKAELRQAKASIEASERVNAGRYAKEEIIAAKDRYIEALDLVEKDNKKAKAKAIEAKKQGDTAYFKSITSFVKDAKTDVDATLQKAKDNHADKGAPRLYQAGMKSYSSLQQNTKELEQLTSELEALKKAGEKK